MIRYTTGDAARPVGTGPKIIAHICNDQGGWGRGFVLALSRWDDGPERAYRRWFSQQGLKDFYLGAVEYVPYGPKDDETYVANMIAQRGIRSPGQDRAVDYLALDCALQQVGARASHLNASVHMPRIGCGLGGGTWDEIEPIIQATLVTRGIDVTVYDLDTTNS
jgi:O-acetyl-ADP-ribose deacetylase (regulator of RNase III)